MTRTWPLSIAMLLDFEFPVRTFVEKTGLKHAYPLHVLFVPGSKSVLPRRTALADRPRFAWGPREGGERL